MSKPFLEGGRVKILDSAYARRRGIEGLEGIIHIRPDTLREESVCAVRLTTDSETKPMYYLKPAEMTEVDS